MRAVKQDKWLERKLTDLLVGWLTQVAFEDDSEAEEMGEGEESEAVGTEDVGMTGGTQLLAMEVDEEEDEVVVVVEIKWGKMQKWALSSPPKMSRKRVHMGMVTQTLAGSQVQGGLVQGSQAGSRNAGSMGRPCERCVKHWIPCMVVGGRVRCKNCWAKHYGCLLILAREGVGGRSGPSGS